MPGGAASRSRGHRSSGARPDARHSRRPRCRCRWRGGSRRHGGGRRYASGRRRSPTAATIVATPLVLAITSPSVTVATAGVARRPADGGADEGGAVAIGDGRGEVERVTDGRRGVGLGCQAQPGGAKCSDRAAGGRSVQANGMHVAQDGREGGHCGRDLGTQAEDVMHPGRSCRGAPHTRADARRKAGATRGGEERGERREEKRERRKEKRDKKESRE